jgi:hypothetical protein
VTMVAWVFRINPIAGLRSTSWVGAQSPQKAKRN